MEVVPGICLFTIPS